jgi:ubiquinone/menaquinone biosynthesis C-methylase UbiE
MDAQTSDFSRIALQYDATRNIPNGVLTTCYDRLIECGVLAVNEPVIDVGCGTGQMSVPLAERGGIVRGIDISQEMIQIARSKMKSGWRVTFATGDARDLPAKDNSFGAAIVSKLFQHIQDWRKACREIVRVVRPGGHIIHVNERGAFGNAVRRHFAIRANELGFAGRYLGIDPHTRAELTEFLISQKCRPVSFDTSGLRWETSISYGEAMSQIEEGLFAEFWYLPDDIRYRIISDTTRWIDNQPDGAATIERLTPYLESNAFRLRRIRHFVDSLRIHLV